MRDSGAFATSLGGRPGVPQGSVVVRGDACYVQEGVWGRRSCVGMCAQLKKPKATQREKKCTLHARPGQRDAKRDENYP